MTNITIFQRRQLYSDIISLIFILLFIYAAVSKIADFQKFKVQLGQSPILSPFASVVVWAVPALEICISVMLSFRRSQFSALYLSFSLMVVFTAYIIAILNFSEYVPCSCGGILQNMTWKQHLEFNFLFVMIGSIGVLIYPNTDQKSIAIGGDAENLESSRQSN